MSEIWNFVSGNIVQFIDVLLVAAIFYYLFVYVRGTKVAVVLQAIVLLSVFYFICQYFKLITLVFILEKIFLVGPIALLIIFAPEIREALTRGGELSPLIAWFAPKQESGVQATVLDTIIDTVLGLAEKNLGALFVIEMKEVVDNHLVPGTTLEALPSKRLLMGLFDGHNPLHDGAVMIRNERIHSAGNILPVSESTFLDDDLGTRHRAAVGLTERCDAVVVVVSEERGEVSIAYNGRLARWLVKEQFVEQLKALVEANENYVSIVPKARLI